MFIQKGSLSFFRYRSPNIRLTNLSADVPISYPFLTNDSVGEIRLSVLAERIASAQLPIFSLQIGRYPTKPVISASRVIVSDITQGSPVA